MLTRATRLFHTVRYLKPVQIYGRALKALRRVHPRTGLAPGLRIPASVWSLPPWRPPSLIDRTRFRFLNVEHELSAPTDWDNPDWPLLWRYNLHYFDDLDAIGAANRQAWHEALIDRWITENPAPTGPGWEPYCLSLRIVNWCRHAWSGRPLSDETVQSLAVQVRALVDQIEIHLLGNHLWANAKALIFAGLFFEGEEANRWLHLGLKHLVPQLHEQILADGAHFELSPMYHAIIAADVLDLIAANRVMPGVLPIRLTDSLSEVAGRMVAWAEMMSHPDGDISFFNDAAFGIAPRASDLAAQLAALKLARTRLGRLPVWKSENAGYVRAEVKDAVLFVDLAKVGPDYLPGHAHADTLSCELSLFGSRFLVNTGTSIYESSPDRYWERSTTAHNTVVVDGHDSSEVWSSFRVARRASPRDLHASHDSGSVVLAGSHNGYHRLPGRVTHRRHWSLKSSSLEIIDRLDGSWTSAEAIWLLHPATKIRAVSGDRIECVLGGHSVRLELEGGDAVVEEAYWAPEFGRRLPTMRIRCDFTSDQLKSHWLWI